MRVVVENREFVITWLNSETVNAASEALGISPAAASARASYLRKMGVKIPKMRRVMSDKHLEVAQLNSLIKKELEKKSREHNEW